MDRLRRSMRQHSLVGSSYQPISPDQDDDQDTTINQNRAETPFSWIDYGVFLLLGISMLWAWYVAITDTQLV